MLLTLLVFSDSSFCHRLPTLYPFFTFNRFHVLSQERKWAIQSAAKLVYRIEIKLRKNGSSTVIRGGTVRPAKVLCICVALIYLLRVLGISSQSQASWFVFFPPTATCREASALALAADRASPFSSCFLVLHCIRFIVLE